MKVHTSSNEKDVIISNGNIVGSASISSNGSLFKILAENLYKDPIKAFVRELMFNAWDSHKASGKTSIPIKIDVTDTLFTIQDFGTGIPHDKINEIYLTYGDSTKLDSNTLTGGFGLGSKSPFGYTNYFTIINIYNNKKVIYRIVKNGEKLNTPQIIKVHSEDTEECNGLTVSVPINKSDKNTINISVKHFSYYGEMFVNDVNNNLNLTEEDNYLFLDTSLERKVYFLYGGILYPYKDSSTLYFTGSIKNNKGLLIKVPEEVTLSITPSRDSLHFDDKTNSYCNSLLHKTINKINNKILKCIKEFSPIYINIVKNLKPSSITIDIEESIREHISNYKFNNYDIEIYIFRYIKNRFINNINKSFIKRVIKVNKILKDNIENYKFNTSECPTSYNSMIYYVTISSKKSNISSNFIINTYRDFRKVYPLLKELSFNLNYFIPTTWYQHKRPKLIKKPEYINYKWQTINKIDDIYSIKKTLKKVSFRFERTNNQIIIPNNINRPLRTSDFTNKELIIYNILSILDYNIYFLRKELIDIDMKVSNTNNLLSIIKDNELIMIYFILSKITLRESHFYRIANYVYPNKYIYIYPILVEHINSLFIDKEDRINYLKFIKTNYTNLYSFFSILKEGIDYISNKTHKQFSLDNLSIKEIKELARSYNKIAKLNEKMKVLK